MRCLLALCALLVAAPAAAHVRLDRSTPAAGAIVPEPLAELRVVFSAAVEARYTSLVLYAPSGAIVPLDSLRGDADSRGRAYYVLAPRLPEPGEYRLEWRTAGADGHVITGWFTFVADPGAVTAADDAAAATGQPGEPGATPGAAVRADPGIHEHHAAAPPTGVFAAQSPLHVLVRALQFALLLALVGAFGLGRLLLPRATLAARRAALAHRLRRYTALVLSGFLLLLPLRLWLQSGALHGPDAALDPYLLRSMLTELTWGRAWLAQLVLAGIVALTFATPLLPLAELATAALAFTPAFLGHAAGALDGRALIVASHGVHVLATGLWIGTLAALFIAGLPALRAADEQDVARAADAVGRFSPLALGAAAVAVGAGVLMAWLHLGTPDLLATTAYGRTLAIKLALLSLVFLTGFLNWRRAGSRPAAEMDLSALRGRIRTELVAAAAVIAVTAVLVAQPAP